MLDMWFIDTIEDIWNRLDTIEQALTFSATLPDEVMHLLKNFIGEDYTHIAIEQKVVVDTVDHMFIQMPAGAKYEYLKEMLTNNNGMKTLVFCEMKRTADDLARRLDQDGFNVDALHGDMDQRDRFHTLRRIKNDEVNVLVATDVAARWLNMNKVDLVINYEAPNDPESYVHRIGRTARAGRSGSAIMFLDRNEMRKLYAIERTTKIRIKQVNEKGEEVERTDRPQRSWSGGWRRGGNNYRFRRGWWGWWRSWGRSSGWYRGRGRNSWGRSWGWEKSSRDGDRGGYRGSRSSGGYRGNSSSSRSSWGQSRSWWGDRRPSSSGSRGWSSRSSSGWSRW